MHGGSNGIAGEGVDFSATNLLWWSRDERQQGDRVLVQKKRPRTIRAVKRGRGGGIGDSPTRKRTKPNTNKPNEAMQGNVPPVRRQRPPKRDRHGRVWSRKTSTTGQNVAPRSMRHRTTVSDVQQGTRQSPVLAGSSSVSSSASGYGADKCRGGATGPDGAAKPPA
ncbi:unnamed protein product, partial [Ectocarpus sp. 6 AP-2014]